MSARPAGALRLARARSTAALAVALGAGLLAACGEAGALTRPRALWLLALVPSLVLLHAWGAVARRRSLARFADPAQLARLTAGASPPRRAAKAGLVLVAVAGLALALAGPRWGHGWEEITGRGTDLVVVVDVSDSMLANDAEESGDLTRLARARREAVDLMRRLGDDRVAIVAFAGEAVLACPLTLDHAAAELFAGALAPDLVPLPGSSIGAGLRTALGAFQGSSHPARAIVLISDGEDHEGGARGATDEVRRAGVPVFAIGVGGDTAAPVPDGRGGLRRAAGGDLVLTRRDEASLRSIAAATGGRYVRSEGGDRDLEALYDAGLAHLGADREGGADTRRRRWRERFQWPLAAALAALALEPFLGERRRVRHGFRRITGVRWSRPELALAVVLAASPAVLGLARAGSPTAASPAASATDPHAAYEAGRWEEALTGFLSAAADRPGDPEPLLGAGSARYRLGDFAGAARDFAAAAEVAAGDARRSALYNLGNSEYRLGRPEEAAARWQEALALDPGDEDARFNLDLVRRQLAEPAAAQRPQGSPAAPDETRGDDGSAGRPAAARPGGPGQEPADAADEGRGGEERPAGPPAATGAEGRAPGKPAAGGTEGSGAEGARADGPPSPPSRPSQAEGGDSAARGTESGRAATPAAIEAGSQSEGAAGGAERIEGPAGSAASGGEGLARPQRSVGLGQAPGGMRQASGQEAAEDHGGDSSALAAGASATGAEEATAMTRDEADRLLRSVGEAPLLARYGRRSGWISRPEKDW